MTPRESRFVLSESMEIYLRALAKLYAQEGKREEQAILVNAQARIEEQWTQEIFQDRDRVGHALYLTVPESLYLTVVRKKDILEQRITSDINRMHSSEVEYIARVFIELGATEPDDWRADSGLQRMLQSSTPMSDVHRIWGEGGYRVFLSHRAEDAQTEVARLKDLLSPYGVTAFVAHVDIDPTEEWEIEIQKALSSMDAFVAIVTSGFHASPWTDQEIGYALCRRVPMVTVKIDGTPCGFISRFQALTSSWGDIPVELVKLLLRDPPMVVAYVASVSRCTNYDQGNTLAQVLPFIEGFTTEQITELVSAFNDNHMVTDSFGFNGKVPNKYGEGLAYHLKRLTGNEYAYDSTGRFGPVP